jgi:hypothetical protein
MRPYSNTSVLNQICIASFLEKPNRAKLNIFEDLGKPCETITDLPRIYSRD